MHQLGGAIASQANLGIADRADTQLLGVTNSDIDIHNIQVGFIIVLSSSKVPSAFTLKNLLYNPLKSFLNLLLLYNSAFKCSQKFEFLTLANLRPQQI